MEVILYSSGIDSYILYQYLSNQKHDIKCVYFNIQSRYSKFEMEKMRTLPFDVIIDNSINLSNIEKANAYIPNRNIILSILTVSKYSDVVWIGGTCSDRINDNNEKVFDELSRFLSNMNQRNIKISSPFWDVYKTDIVKWFHWERAHNKKYDISPGVELLEKTFSCYYPDDNCNTYTVIDNDNEIQHKTSECLDCSACFRKNVELNVIGVFRPFYNNPIIEKYHSEFINPISKTPRSIATMNYIIKLQKNEKR